MARPRSTKRELFAAVVSIVIGIVGAVDLIGHPARLVHVLTIFAGGFGAGAGLSRALDRLRAERRTVEPATSTDETR
jgi:hypothetical protein